MRLLTVLAASLLVCTNWAWAGPEKKLAGNDVFDNPKKQIDFGKLKYLKKSDTIIIPYVEVKLQNWGTQGAVAQTRGFGGGSTQTSQSRSTVSVAFNPELAQEVATTLHKDLIAKLKAEGWKVLTLDDVKGNKGMKKVKWAKTDKNTLSQGLRVERKDGKFLGMSAAGGGGAGYVIALPKGQDFIKPPIQGPAWPFRKVVSSKKANIYIPSYTINTVNFKTEEKSRSRTASTSVSFDPLVSFAGASTAYLNPKAAGGAIALKQDAYGLNNGVSTGKVVDKKDVSPAAANALGSAFRAIGGAGISSAKNEYVVEADEAALKAEAIKLGQAFNDVTARAMGLYKGK